jgi:hypothetical protein
MGLLEWIGESYDPGEIGSVQVGRGEPPRRSAAAVITCFVITVGLLLAAYLGLYFGFPDLGWNSWLIIAGVSLGYFLLAYFIRPAPDMENIGWLGGMIDHPWRYSDDINRTLLMFLIVLYPGRFVGESVLDMGLLLLGRKPVRRRRRFGRRPKDRLKEWEPGSGGSA